VSGRPNTGSGYAAGPSRLAAEHPEGIAYAISAVCWAALLLVPAGRAAAAFCVGDDRLAALSFSAGAALAGFEWTPALSHWLTMVGAMMLPMAAMALRHVAFRSLPERRGRAMAGFIAGYWLVWLAVAPLYLLAGVGAHVLANGAVLPPLAAALALAAAWQAAPARKRALRLCHRIVPLPPSGWAADRACVAFGLEHGRACLVSCWALMLVPVAAGHHPALMLGVMAAGLAERRIPRVRPERGVLPLAAGALLCAAAAGIA
jgi:predicted metal-binding membrane protein